MIVMKKIIRCLKGTRDYGLRYKKYDDFNLKVYSYFDWAHNVDDRKSTIGEAFFLTKWIITWTRKKESYISKSTIASEYVTILFN